MNYPPLIVCSSISTLLPFLTSASIIRQPQKYPNSLVFLWVFFVLSVVAEITMYILNLLNKHSAWISHIYTPVEYFLITLILASWQRKTFIARLMRISIPIYILFFVLIKIAGLENFSADTTNYVTRPLAILFLSTFTFVTLQALWNHIPADLVTDFRFWMLLAMALYYNTSIILFSFTFTKNLDLLDILYRIHAVVHIIHNVLFTIGVFYLRGAKQAALQPTPAS